MLSLNAIKHLILLFVILLSTDLKNWKNLLSNLSFFTLGVFVMLLLTNYSIIHIKTNVLVLVLWFTIALLSIFKIININKGAFFSLLIGIFGALHGLKIYHHYSSIFSKKTIFIPTFFYSLGIEIATIIFSIIATGALFLISFTSKTSKNNTESILNTLLLFVSCYFIINYFI